jgi:hypothetical protein
VVAKVTSLRDFFVTLFFVGLGMEIPVPTWGFMWWTLWFCLFIIGSRVITIFPPLYSLKQGYRVGVLSTVNLCQMSELSLVLLALGLASGEVSEHSAGIAAFSFAFLAVGSTYAILKNDTILRKISPQLNRLGLRDLYQTQPETGSDGKSRRICLLGFSWTASSLIEGISREYATLLPEIVVVDFNPRVYERLQQREVAVAYGDITQRETLLHAGIAESEIIICSLPNTVLKGADNLKMLRQLRELNPHAQIVVHAELLEDIPKLYAAGASYVTAPRLLEAADLLNVIDAVENNLLDEKRAEQARQLKDRNEVIP